MDSSETMKVYFSGLLRRWKDNVNMNEESKSLKVIIQLTGEKQI